LYLFGVSFVVFVIGNFAGIFIGPKTPAL